MRNNKQDSSLCANFTLLQSLGKKQQPIKRHFVSKYDAILLLEEKRNPISFFLSFAGSLRPLLAEIHFVSAIHHGGNWIPPRAGTLHSVYDGWFVLFSPTTGCYSGKLQQTDLGYSFDLSPLAKLLAKWPVNLMTGAEIPTIYQKLQVTCPFYQRSWLCCLILTHCCCSEQLSLTLVFIEIVELNKTTFKMYIVHVFD